MKIGDKVISHMGTDCIVTGIFRDGSHLMARAKPVSEIKNDHGNIVLVFTDPVEVFEARNNPTSVIEENND